MLSIKDIEFSYPSSDFHLKVEELIVEKGSNLAIIGPSGCGKTTLLNLISGIMLPEHGSVSFENNVISSLPDTQRRRWRSQYVGFVFQDFRLFDYLTVKENILIPLIINGEHTSIDFIERASSLGHEMGILHLFNKYPSKLSQGEKQRCAIARALLLEPKIILGDEVTGNLDPKNKEIILEKLLDYAKSNESVLLVVTHDHNLLASFSAVYDFNEAKK